MIRIVTDSSSDVPAALAAEHGVTIVPLTIRFGDDEFVDHRDLSAAAFWERLVAVDRLPETAAPSAGLFEESYRSLIDGGASGIVVMTISSALSGTYQSAVIAAERLSGDIPIKIIDSRTVGMGLGLPVLDTARFAAGGPSIDAVVQHATDTLASTDIVAALDTLEYLKRGGRIGSAQAFFGGLLNIKPLIGLDEGIVSPLGRVRTRSRAVAALEERFAALGPRIRATAVFHGAAPDVDLVVERIQRHVDHEVIVTTLGAVVGTHTGPGTVGVAYLTN